MVKNFEFSKDIARDESTKSKIDITVEPNTTYYYDFTERYRWVITISVICLTAFVGPPFMNWPPLHKIFESVGVYHYLCETSDLSDVCLEQNRAIENLGGFCSSVYFSFTLVCGILLDCLGPKICGMIGLGTNSLGWLIVGVSGSNHIGNRIGLILISISVDCIFFGIISVSNLFPNNSSFILSLLGASRSISFGIPIIMKELIITVGLNFSIVCLIQAGILIILLISVILWIPYRSYPKVPALIRAPDPKHVSLKKYLNQLPNVSFKSFKKEFKQQYKRQTQYIYRIDFCIYVFVICIALLRVTYFIETAKAHLPTAIWFFETVSPFSFIPCPLMGYIADRVSAALVCSIIACCGAASLVCVMIGGPVLEYIAVIFNWVYISFIASQCYCYIAYIYTQMDLGKLTGVCFLAAGLISLASSPMNNYSKNGSKQLLAMDLLVTILGCMAFVVTVLLYIYLEKPIRRRKKESLLLNNQYSHIEDIKAPQI